MRGNEGRTVIAALADDSAAEPVVAVSLTIADVVGARVSAVHVGGASKGSAATAARAAQLPLRSIEGPIVASLTRVAAEPGVQAIVLGLRGVVGAPDQLGKVTAEVAQAVGVPALLVPLQTSTPFRLRSILVPMQGDPANAASLATTIRVVRAAELEVIVVHVTSQATIPSFEDQATHETEAWAREFIARYVPVPPKETRFEWRVGDPAEQMLAVAAEARVDLIALGWARDLGPGRATVVRRLMERSPVPLLLLPVMQPDTDTPRR